MHNDVIIYQIRAASYSYWEGHEISLQFFSCKNEVLVLLFLFPRSLIQNRAALGGFTVLLTCMGLASAVQAQDSQIAWNAAVTSGDVVGEAPEIGRHLKFTIPYKSG